MVRVARRSTAIASPGAVSPARRCAYRVVRRVLDGDAFADRAFRAEADREQLEGRERAFAQQLAYGTIQRLATIDYVLSAISSRPVRSIDPALRDVLRLGVFQIVYLGGVPDPAAVAQTVELAKVEAGRGHRFANALLRRAAREGRDLVEDLSDSSPAEAAVLHSHPEWLVRMWWDLFGRDEAVALLERDNTAPESAVRANELVITTGELLRLLSEEGVWARPVDGLPEALVIETPFDVHGSRLFDRGALMPQSRGSMMVARALAPKPGERVLDLCAAPGAKTTHLAALMQGRGELVAVERHPGRADALKRNCRRLGAPWIQVVQADALSGQPRGSSDFDRVLLDPPCSDLGTLQARPDVRWRKSAEQIDELARLQARLLRYAASRVRPGGTLVYSTCTISPRENEEQVHAFLARRGDFELDDLALEHPSYRHPTAARFLQLLPHRHGTDGFFIARLRRSAEPA